MLVKPTKEFYCGLMNTQQLVMNIKHFDSTAKIAQIQVSYNKDAIEIENNYQTKQI